MLKTYWIKFTGNGQGLDIKDFEEILASDQEGADSCAYDSAKEDWYYWDQSGYEIEDIIEDDPTITEEEAYDLQASYVEEQIDYIAVSVPWLELQIEEMRCRLEKNPLDKWAEKEFMVYTDYLGEINDLRNT